MAYYDTGITISAVDELDLGLVVRAATTHTDKVVQCYVSGQLRDRQAPRQGSVRFHLPQTGTSDVIFLLAADADCAETDYWHAAFPAAASNGNRIRLRTPQVPFLGAGCTWRVYRGGAGDAEATILVHEQAFYPGNRRGLGYGMCYGGQYGFDGDDCYGYGYAYGHSYGFDCMQLTWLSDPLPPGTYPVKVLIADEHGNESAEAAESAALATYPRPASGLAVASYDGAADCLELTWTASDDVS